MYKINTRTLASLLASGVRITPTLEGITQFINEINNVYFARSYEKLSDTVTK